MKTTKLTLALHFVQLTLFALSLVACQPEAAPEPPCASWCADLFDLAEECQIDPQCSLETCTENAEEWEAEHPGTCAALPTLEVCADIEGLMVC
jgi:hypothetical protein